MNLRDGGEGELGMLRTKSERRRRRAQINDEEVEIDDGEAEIDDEQHWQRVDIDEEQIVRLRLGHISVRSGFFGFWGENPPTDPSLLGSGGRDPSPTVIDVGSAGSRAGSDGLGGWVGSWFLLDTPTPTILISSCTTKVLEIEN